MRSSEAALERNRAPESVLLHITEEINSMRRAQNEKINKFRLKGEDITEDRELRGYIITAVAQEVTKLLVTCIQEGFSNMCLTDQDKIRDNRLSDAAEWIGGRGESEQGQ